MAELFAGKEWQTFLQILPTIPFETWETVWSTVVATLLALVIGVPVGFVNVVESKERLFAVCESHGVPAIVAMGRKGGSNVAAAICNALIYSAAEMLDPTARGWK